MPRYSVDENGRYIISGLYAGTYTINTDAVETEFLDDSKTVDVKLGQTTNVDFVLRKGRVFVTISGYVTNTAVEPLSNVPVWIKNVQSDMEWINTTNEDGHFEFTNVSAGLYQIQVNREGPELLEYTAVEFAEDNLLNVSEDLQTNFTLWRLGIDMTVDPRECVNGDTVDVEITVTNNDVHNLVNWEAFAELLYENDVHEVLDFDVVPISVGVGKTKSITVTLRIPEDNIYSNLDVDAEIRNGNFLVSSNMGTLTATGFSAIEQEDIVWVELACEDPVNFVEFSLLAQQWGLTGANLICDFNGDEVVGIEDLQLLSEYWLQDCP